MIILRNPRTGLQFLRLMVVGRNCIIATSMNPDSLISVLWGPVPVTDRAVWISKTFQVIAET